LFWAGSVIGKIYFFPEYEYVPSSILLGGKSTGIPNIWGREMNVSI
jgi:hypothetical protein